MARGDAYHVRILLVGLSGLVLASLTKVLLMASVCGTIARVSNAIVGQSPSFIIRFGNLPFCSRIFLINALSYKHAIPEFFT
jgi:hypothetical protein